MKKTALFFLVSLLNLPAFSQETPADPGIQRPDSPRIINTISSELKLSSKQEEKIKRAVDKEAKDFDKIFTEYEKKAKELKDLEYGVNELKHKMLKINKNLPDVIREFLDDEQKLRFDQLTAPKPKPEEPKVKAEEGAAGQDQGTQTKKKKKVLIKRKKGQPAKGAQVPGAEAADKTADPAAQPKSDPNENKQPESPPADEEGVYYP